MSMNPYDFLQLIAAASASRKNPTQAGINRLFMPEAGILTGTYFQDPSAGQGNDDYLYAQHAPDIQRALMLPDTDVRKMIVADILERGMNVWDVQRNIEAYAAGQSKLNPGVYATEAETSDLKKFAQTIQSQADNLRAAKLRSSADMIKDDPYAKAGLPQPEMRFAPEQLLPDFFSKYVSESNQRSQRLGTLKTNDAARKAAAKFLSDQSGQFDAVQGDLRSMRPADPGYFDSDRRSQEGLKSTAKEVERLQADYQKALDDLARVSKSYTPISKGSMTQQQAIDAAKIRVEKTKKLFDDKYANASSRGLYSPSARSNASASDPETIRFRGIAERAAKTDDTSKERLALVKRQKMADDVARLVAERISRKAEESGYTPFMQSMMQRAMFTGLGGS